MAMTPTTNRMLIVEDDPGVRRLMTTHFRQNGFEVEYAMAAEEVAADERYDVVLADVHLPGESGVEMVRRIHRVQPNQQVVFVTGDSDSRVAREALQAGAAGYLLKPFEMFELDAVVNTAIRQSSRSFQPHMHVTNEPLVVLSPRRHHSGPSLKKRIRTAATVLLMVGIAWGVGALISPPQRAAISQASVTGNGGSNPVVVPVVVEKSVYLR